MTQRCQTILPAASWPLAAATDVVRIDFDRRHRRRILLTTEQGGLRPADAPRTAPRTAPSPAPASAPP